MLCYLTYASGSFALQGKRALISFLKTTRLEDSRIKSYNTIHTSTQHNFPRQISDERGGTHTDMLKGELYL